jgi:hypothetical protein
VIGHVGQQFLNVLFAGLCAQNEQVESVGLNFNDDFRDGSFECQTGHQLLVVLLSKLFFAELHAHDRLQLVLNLRVGENNITVYDAELHPIQLLDAERLRLQGLVESENFIVFRHFVQFLNFDFLREQFLNHHFVLARVFHKENVDDIKHD